MGLGMLNKGVLRGGLGIAAALLLSTAVFAQDASGDEGTSSVTTVQNWHDLNPGIAVGEPDPTAGGDEGIAVGEPDPSGDGSEPDPGDAGDDAGDGDGPDIVIDDGLCIGADCTPDEGTDPGDDHGTDVTETDETGTEPEVGIYTLDGVGAACIDCNIALNDAPVAIGRPGNHTKVERTHTAKPRVHAGSGSSDGSDVALTTTNAMAQCMSQHARSTWICEWQNGAGQ